MDKNTAQEYYEDINNRFKIAFVREHNKNITGDIFQFERSTRKIGDFSLSNPIEKLPRLVFETNLNEKHRDVLLSYLTGTHALDPFEAYRLTLGLNNKDIMKNSPSPAHIKSTIEYLWEGHGDKILIGKSNEIYKPSHTFETSMYRNNSKKSSPMDVMTHLREIWKKCF